MTLNFSEPCPNGCGSTFRASTKQDARDAADTHAKSCAPHSSQCRCGVVSFHRTRHEAKSFVHCKKGR